MLKIVTSTKARLTEKFHVYSEDGAEIESAITVFGKTRKQSEWDVFHQGLADDARDIPVHLKNAEFFGEVFQDWEVADEQGNKLVCSVENIAIVLDSPAGPQITAALQRAAFRLRYGTPVKN